LQTGSRTRILTAANPWLASAIYYDAEYRPVQKIRELYDLGAGAIERVSMQYKYDLAPVVAQEKTEQIIATGINVHQKTYEYDHADRLLSLKEKVVNGDKSGKPLPSPSVTMHWDSYSKSGCIPKTASISEEGPPTPITSEAG
jgi:hypothetical protein